MSYLALMFALTVLYFALPEQPRYLWTLIGCSSVVAIMVGILLNRPRRTLPWWLVAAGTATFIAGDTTYDLLTGALGLETPFPSAADVFYLCTYPFFAGGLLLVVRARSDGRDRQALLDALIITISLGLLVWVFLAAPYARDGTMTAIEKGFSIAYPLGDVLLLSVLARLLTGRGGHSSALRFLTLGTVGLLVSDVLYGLIQLNGSWQTGGPVDLGWIIFYVAWGAAALQPDMVQLAEPERLSPQVMSRARLSLIGSVSLIPPIVLLVQARTLSLYDIELNALASAAIFVLVTVRLSGLVQVARQSTQRENVLRRTGESLVGASSREEIYAVSAYAIAAMTGAPDDHRVLVAVAEDNNLPRLVHDSATLDSSSFDDRPSAADLGDLVARHGAQLSEHYFVLTNSDQSGEVLLARLGSDVPVLLAALVRAGTVAGVVAVAGGEVERTDIIDAVCAMAAQMMLALESADLTEQVLQRKNDAHFSSLIQNTSDMILVVNADLSVIYLTPSVRAVLGHESDAVMGQPVLGLLSALDAPRASSLLRRVQSAKPRAQHGRIEPDDEWRLVDAEGNVRAFEVTCRNLLEDPSVRGLVLTLHDTTERRALEEELKHLAFHDSLTQLPNRALFLDRVEHALSRQGRHRERLAVMLIDLDDFKMVNDTRGHAAGDALLVAIGERLRLTVRPQDTCARLGGDEFAVLVEGLVGDDEAGQLAERILTALRQPYGIIDDGFTVRASIGLSTSVDEADAAEMLIQADLAMYAAKDAGRGTYEFYRPSLQDVMQTRLTKNRDLEKALEEGQFVLHYQPVLHLGSGRVVGTEALVRWQHPDRGLVLPSEFIDVVEQGDLAVPLGQWVIETAVAQAVAWQLGRGGSNPLHMSVNVAPRQLSDPGFIAIVTNALRLHGLSPNALVLEITERMLAVQEPQIVRAMGQLKELGIGLAIDDFGTGYAALGYLRRFPVTTLKIDRSFVSGMDKSADDRALIEAIIQLGDTFALDLVAEGIETPGQRDTLVALGCEHGQGFLFARALPAAEATAYITAHSEIEVDQAYNALTQSAERVPIR